MGDQQRIYWHDYVLCDPQISRGTSETGGSQLTRSQDMGPFLIKNSRRVLHEQDFNY